MADFSTAIIRDVIGSLPAAGKPGRLFIATDTHRILRDNGSTWDDLVLLKKLNNQSIANTATTIAHGLGMTPTIVVISPRANAVFWESSAADATNVYIQCSVNAQACDIYIAA